jgi:mono/diheme cytochrome c family protein
MSSDQLPGPGPTRGIPQIFGTMIVFALIAAGLIAIAGFAIHKGAAKDNSAALDPSNAAAAELYEAGIFQPSALELAAEIELGVLTDETQAVEPEDPEAGGGNSGEAPEADLSDPDALLAAGDAAHGQELFFANGCNACHGDNGEGLIGPTIAQTGLTLSQVVGQYRTPRGIMPAIDADRLSDQDVADIVTWLQTLELPETIVEGLGTP